MQYRYDPIMGLNIPIETSKTRDASSNISIVKDANVIRGYFINASGKTFHKDFPNSYKLMDFAREVKSNGGEFIGESPIPSHDSLDPNEECPEGMVCDATYIKYVDFKDDSGKEKIKYFSSNEEAKSFIEKNDGKTIAVKASNVHDATRILKQSKGYTLGINSQGTIYLAFPGETENNPHMYLGKETDENIRKAQAYFESFVRQVAKDAMYYDPVACIMRPVKDAIAVTVDESDYRSSHAKYPSGYGHWIFGIGSKNMSDWFEVTGNYKNAREKARQEASNRGARTIYTMG